MRVVVSLLLLGAAWPAGAQPAAAQTTGGATPAASPSATLTLGPLALTPSVDLFGAFDARWPTDASRYDAFTVPRALAGFEVSGLGLRGRLLMEGVYSTEGGALVGTAGDSEVLRLREAWGGYRWRFLEARLGMIPSPLFAPLEHAWALRELAADGIEAYGLAHPADLGASLRAWLPADFGWVALSATNGEGYTQRELNRGKSFDLSLTLRPVRSLRPLELVANGTLGSTGLAQTRADRLGGGVLWDDGWLGAGATAHAFFGLEDDGGRRGLLLQGFVRARFFDRLLVAVRADHLWRDFSAAGDDSSTTLVLAVGAQLWPGVELMAEYQREALSPLARSALPGTDANVVRVVARLDPFASQLEDWR